MHISGTGDCPNTIREKLIFTAETQRISGIEGLNYKKFEELPCWQKSRELCREVFKLINSSGLRKDFALRDQLWRAAGSVMDNIAEGFDDGSTREFIKFLGYSQRSCSEVQS